MAGQTRIDGNLIDTGTDPNDIVSVSVGDARYPRLSQDNTLAGNLTVDGDLNLVATGAGTGVFTIAAPDSNTNRTLTLPDEAGTVLTDVGVPSSAMPAGSVIQVVRDSMSTSVTISSNSATSIGLSVSLTPKVSNSTVIALVQISSEYEGGSNHGYENVGLYRDGVEVDSGGLALYNNSSAFQTSYHVSPFQFIDTPNTTNAVNYDVRLATYIGNPHRFTSAHSHITLMEIAG